MNLSELQQQQLNDSALLRFFPAEVRPRLLACFSVHQYGFGELIVTEGEPADSYYLLSEGKARVLKHADNGAEIPLNVLRPGDGFGEAALLQQQQRRTASVRASKPVTVLRLTAETFDDLLAQQPELRSYLELQARHRTLSNFLRQFSSLGKTSAEALQALLAAMQPLRVKTGDQVVTEGDAGGPMYVIKSGRLCAYREAAGTRTNLAFLREGDFFGELSLLNNAPRAASVEAVTDCELLVIEPEAFHQIHQRYPEFRALIAQRIAQYHAEQEARIPLDFAQEMLPAEAIQATPKAEQYIPTDEAKTTRHHRAPRRFPFIQQVDEMDCGAAALGMVCRHFGRKVSMAHIRQLAHTSRDGTSLRALCQAAEQLGLDARGVRINADHLDETPLPAIAHWEGNHWVVLVAVEQERVRIADPALGLRWLDRKEFTQRWSGFAALFDYTERFEQAPEERGHNLAWVWPFIRPFKLLILQALLLAIVVSGLQMTLPIFTQVVVDRVIVEKDIDLMQVMLLAMFAALLLMVGTHLLQRYFVAFAAVRIDAGILDYLMRRMLALPMSYFNSRRIGDIQRRLDGARQVRQFVVQSGIGGVLSVIQLLAILLLMGAYSTTLLLVFFATAPLYVGMMYFSARILKPVFNRLEESHSRYRSRQIDAISGIEAVKAGGAEQAFRDALLNEFQSVANTQFRSQFTIMSYDSVLQVIGFLSTLLFLWVGGMMVMEGQLSIGAFVAFHALVNMGYGAIQSVLGLWDELQLASVLMNRLRDIFDCEPEQGHDHSQLRPVPSLEGKVEFCQLGFRYGGSDAQAILSHINFKVQPGTTVAIIGRSGSGKTTLAKCLSGLLEPTEGSIRFDGVEMQKLNYRDLRRQIGFVLQENYMFAGTILENIAFGELDPDLDRAIWAAKMANAHDFIMALPLGFDSRIGESGMSLSGGQRQRIAIARALYHNPPLLIFDEATSALDTESEKAIQDNMKRLLQGRTAFVIAHRLSTIREADVILVLEKGQIAEYGTHDELMDRKGLYFYLSSRQMGDT